MVEVEGAGDSLVLKVPGDGDGTGVQSGGPQLGAQGQDPGGGFGAGGAWDCSAGRLERGSTAAMPPAAVTPEEFVHPAAADSVPACRISNTQALGHVTARTMTFCFDMDHAQQFPV